MTTLLNMTKKKSWNLNISANFAEIEKEIDELVGEEPKVKFIISRVQAARLREFELTDWITKASNWTTGSGRFTKKKALPPFSAEFSRKDQDLPQNVQAYFNTHRRVLRVIAVTDIEKAKKALRQYY